MLHGKDTSSLNRKFRIWRSDIPRNNCKLDANRTSGLKYSTDASLGIARYSRKVIDRIRNPWVYLKLEKGIPISGNLPKVEIHDIAMTYFD